MTRSFLEGNETNDEVIRDVSKIISDLRKAGRLSYNQAHLLTGCPYGMVRRIEEGQNVVLSRFFLLTKAYGMTFSIRQRRTGKSTGKIMLTSDKTSYLTRLRRTVKRLQTEKEMTEDGLIKQTYPVQNELRRIERGNDIHLKEFLNVLRAFDLALDISYPEISGSPSPLRLPKTHAKNPVVNSDPVPANRIIFLNVNQADEDVLKSIGHEIAAIRTRKEKSLTQMAKLSDSSFGTLRRMELGTNLALEGFLKAAKVYDIHFELRYPVRSQKRQLGIGWKTEILNGKKTPYLQAVGKVIKCARELLDFTQTEAGEKYNLSRDKLSRIECGREGIRIKTFLHLLRSFGIRLRMVYPGIEKKQSFDRLSLPIPDFRNPDKIIRERLLGEGDRVDGLLGKLGEVFRKVRTSRRVSTRDAGSEIGIDNRRLGKIERGMIDLTVGTALQIAAATGVTVAMIYTEISNATERACYGAIPSQEPKRKKIDLTRLRTPYMEAIGATIKSIRLSKGKSLREFGKILGLDGSKVFKLEKGQFDPYMTTLGFIFKKLDICLEVEYTLGDLIAKYKGEIS